MLLASSRVNVCIIVSNLASSLQNCNGFNSVTAQRFDLDESARIGA